MGSTSSVRRSPRVAQAVIAACCFHAVSLMAGTSPWESRGIGAGGALFSPTMSPHDPNQIYMATDMSSVFHTDNFGRTWSTVHFRQLQTGSQSEGVETHVRFTADPKVLYALDLTDERRTPARSTDGGATWQPLPGDPTDTEAYLLDADPHSTKRLMVTSWDTLFFSTNGGKKFRPVYTTPADGAGLRVAGVFWDGSEIFVGTSDGLLISADGGASFDLANIGGIPRKEAIVSLAGAREGQTTRFFAVTYHRRSVWVGITGADNWDYRAVYRLDWGNGDWQKTTTGLKKSAHPFFVAMTLDDVSAAYLAGSDVGTSFPIVYKTEDAGANWSSVFQTNRNKNIYTGWSGHGGDRDWWYGEYALGFAVSPADRDRAVITDLGFAHVTSDGGATWHQAYVDRASENPADSRTPKGRFYRGAGVEDTSSWWLHWTGQSRLIAGFSDIHGIVSEDRGETWASGSTLGLPHNSTYCLAESPTTGTVYAATSSVHDIYQSTHLQDARLASGEGHVVSSDDGGLSWELVKDFGRPVIWLALDPNDPETMYASVIHRATGGLYVTHNLRGRRAASWTRLSAPPRTKGHPYNIHVLKDGALVATYSGRRKGNGAFTRSSGLFVSTDDGTTWDDRSDPGMERWTKDVVIDPHDATQSAWYVTVFSHWGDAPNEVGGIYRTTDRGLSWTRISDLYRVESITVHPDDPDVAYGCTEMRGLWRTRNLTDAAPTFTQVASYCFRHPVRVFFDPSDHNKIWATSFGGGLRVYDASQAADPHIEVSPRKLRLTAKVGRCRSNPVTVVNTGDGTLTVSSVTSTNEHFEVSSPSFPQQIPAGGQVAVVVEFCPSRTGKEKGKLHLDSDDPDDPRVRVKLRGKAKRP